jgi:homocitrate synthase
MCPNPNGDGVSPPTTDKNDMVLVDEDGPTTSAPQTNGVQKRQHGHKPRQPLANSSVNPYAPRYADFLSNISNFSIIESTLRGSFSSIIRST